MAYSAQADVELASGGLANLISLTDFDGAGIVNATSLTAAIASADSWIDSYLQSRYATPLNPVPEHIKRLSAAETVYQLKVARRAVTDDDRLEHGERLEHLRDISAGRAAIGVDPPPAKSTSVVSEAGTREDDTAAVTRDRLEGVW